MRGLAAGCAASMAGGLGFGMRNTSLVSMSVSQDIGLRKTGLVQDTYYCSLEHLRVAA